jgi:hypothetical protein
MNPNDFASLLSSFGGGSGAAGLMQGLQRGGGSTGTSTQQGTTPSLLDTFAQQTADSRPNTAPAGTRAVGTTTNRSGGSSLKPRNGGASSSSSATVPTSTASSATSSGSKSGSIQMSALTSVLANLGNNTSQETGAAAATASSSEPAIDLYDIVTSEVRSMEFSFFFLFSQIIILEFNSIIKQ